MGSTNDTNHIRLGNKVVFAARLIYFSYVSKFGENIILGGSVNVKVSGEKILCDLDTLLK